MGDKFQTSYKADMALFQTLWVKVWLGIFAASLIVCPYFLSQYQLGILNEISIAVIGALGLNLLIGYTGQISLGHGAFVAIGAYTTALTSAYWGLPFVVTLPLSGVMAALLGMIVGVPALRLKGLYLALGTLAFGFIVEYVLFHWDLIQGDMGMAVKRISIGGYEIRTERDHFYCLTAFAVLATLCSKNIIRSKIGRSFIAIRDRDIAAEAMGIPLAKYKVMAFGVSSFYAGIAGGLLAHYQKWIVPGSFDLSLSVTYIAMIVLGGLGTILGSVLGAVLITSIPHGIVYTTDLVKDTYPVLGSLIVDLKVGIFGLIVVLALLFEPQGLAGIYRRVKLYWKTWPFRY
ncbi:MAG: branched-chain amino acid ABC transporter permease [Desulfomonile tiedjei]|uniref:Branched-chain amino acid ABC transporter permease n=1 Tax=Desulfomonile tiedjei TaxID=2358 RepID=A0A9D6V522_9BACT|nr:branched-chain amino acid ABC transporter permease [Desulfomonile tiedjei]